MLCARQVAMQASGTAAFSALRRQLKLDKRTKDEMLAAAVALALDANMLPPTKACADRKLPAGSHTARARVTV